MKRLPLFGCQEFYIISEDCKEGKEQYMTEWPSEIVMVEDLDHWMEGMRSNAEEPYPIFKKEYRKLSNREFMEKHIYGSPYDDSCDEIIDMDCPECGDLLVQDHDQKVYCSECSYDTRDEEVHEKGATMYLHGVDPIKYAEKMGIDLDHRDHLEKCVKCGAKMMELKCFRTSNGYAGVDAKCSCGNSSSTFVPVTAERIAFWNSFLTSL